MRRLLAGRPSLCVSIWQVSEIKLELLTSIVRADTQVVDETKSQKRGAGSWRDRPASEIMIHQKILQSPENPLVPPNVR